MLSNIVKSIAVGGLVILSAFSILTLILGLLCIAYNINTSLLIMPFALFVLWGIGVMWTGKL